MMFISDLKYACRLLSKSPGFTVLTTLVMAAGIGLSVYLFALFNILIYKDMPFEQSDSLVIIVPTKSGVVDWDGINIHDYMEIKSHIKGLSEFSAYQRSNANVSGRDSTRRYDAVLIEGSFFKLTHTKPLLGREFALEESNTGAENVVIIGFDVWQNQFAGTEKIIDQTLRVNGVVSRIVGVMPQGYFFPTNEEIWLPLRQDTTKQVRADAEKVSILARLNSDSSKRKVERELELLMQRIEEQHPKTNTHISAYLSKPQMAPAEGGSSVVRSMHVVAILLLLLASINVGNLLLSRAVERSKETAIRMALGAPRYRLISQMLWESIIICSLGGVIGLLLVAWGLEITEGITDQFSNERSSFWWDFGIDGYVLKMFFGFLFSTIIITGLLPAWKNSNADFNTVLRDGTRGALGKKAGRLNRALVISEIFISITVLICAGTMIISSYISTHANYGANTDNILTAKIRLVGNNYNTNEKIIKFVKALQSRLESNTEINSVMIASALPGEWTVQHSLAIEGKEYASFGEGSYPTANYITIMPGSLGKLGVALKSGRYFSSVDEGLEKKSVIVTDSFVTHHFGNDSPIGKRLRLQKNDNNEWLTIVGVVEHTIQGDIDAAAIPSIFRPFTQDTRQYITIALQVKPADSMVDSASVINAVRKILKSLDSELPIYHIESYEDKIGRHSAPLKFISSVFLLFGLAAMVLATSGIYGVMSNTINQRRQEIGVKRALGANEKNITYEFLIAGFKQLLWGSIPGLLAGCAMGYGMSQNMGASNGALLVVATTITLTIGGVVMFATYWPTKQALQMEPGEALHCN